MKTDYFDKAAQQFANLMIEKIQQVEDNWQKPWITIAANTLIIALNQYQC